jgi:hypothetical protein
VTVLNTNKVTNSEFTNLFVAGRLSELYPRRESNPSASWLRAKYHRQVVSEACYS